MAGETKSRREILKLAASAIIAPAIPWTGVKTGRISAKARTPGNHSFFTAGEFAMLDELSELIIPKDDHSGGAREAKVAEYLDKRIAESFTKEPQEEWRNGLKLVDQLSLKMNGTPFMKSSEEQRVAVLTKMSQNESKPETKEEKFFVELKSSVARAYYTSKIGIHDEMGYMGNTFLKEFVGVDVSKG